MQIDEIQDSDVSTRIGLLKFKLLLESKDMITSIGKVLTTYRDFSSTVHKEVRARNT